MQKNILLKCLLVSGSFLVGLPLIAENAPTKGSIKMDKSGIAPKIAVVDIRRMFSQDSEILKDSASVSHEWRDLYGKLQETLKPINKEITGIQSQFEAKMKELEGLQKSGVSSRDALQKKYNDEVAPLEYKLQMQSQQVQNFTYTELNKIQSILAPKIQKATDAIVKQQGWDFAINKEVMVSSFSTGSRFNITSDVLSLLNADYAKVQLASKKPASPSTKAA